MKSSFCAAAATAAILGCAAFAGASSSDVKNVLTGQDAFTDYTKEKPGTFRKITPADLPQPYATKGVGNGPKLVPRPDNMWPIAPAGFKVEVFTNEGIKEPRELRTAPNGDLFVADTHGNKLEVLRGVTADGKPETRSTFATGLHEPFGIAFYPPGKDPKWVYVGNTNSVVRFPYHNGDMKVTGAAETIIDNVPTGGHSTRDVAFSQDGQKLFLSIGSNSNVDDPDTHPSEHHRANILAYTPDGKFLEVYGSGIRNPVGIAVDPATGQLWCSTNERDMLGDNLVPDYITSVKEGGFYGWPWYYIGGNHDPRLPGKHPELKDKVIVPDVLLQPHNASLQLTFSDSHTFPKQYFGDIFAAEHGSWNKAVRAGYEIIRVPLDHGKASGVYEDFITGFVLPNGDVWGRPVGVAFLHDGSMVFSDDGSNTIWRVVYTGKK